jgi:putative transposase
MRHVNGVYSQMYNRRHGKVGHLFQGRFKAILVDRDAYLLEVCRYVELNPVRAKMVVRPADWAWSSYLAHTAQVTSPPWLNTAELYGHLLGHNAIDAADRKLAVERYVELVAAGINLSLWSEGLRQQMYLGDDAFVDRMRALAEPARLQMVEVPRQQRRDTRGVAQWLKACETRDDAIWNAVQVSGLSMSSIAKELGLSVSRISRIVGAQKGKAKDKM